MLRKILQPRVGLRTLFYIQQKVITVNDSIVVAYSCASGGRFCFSSFVLLAGGCRSIGSILGKNNLAVITVNIFKDVFFG